MPSNALQKLNNEEVNTFLGSGLFLSMGAEKCLVAWGKTKKNKSPQTDKIQFYLPDFYLEAASPWVSFEHVAMTSAPELVATLEEFAKESRLELKFTPPTMADFEKIFRMIQASILKKEINKAVPVLFETTNCSVTKAMRAHSIAHLLKSNRPLTPYGFMTPTSGMIGASPEILFSFDANSTELKTMALAGTRSTELEKQNSLENDEKEIYEHALVVKGLREKLSGMGEWQVSPTYVWNIGPLCHLRTDITVELKSKPNLAHLFQELCLLLHPTAALGVSPIQVDFRYLKKCDGNMERGRFGAPFGVLSPEGKSIALVAIRNMQWDEEGHVRIGSGCGVTEKSDINNEWNELSIKRKSVKDLLGI